MLQQQKQLDDEDDVFPCDFPEAAFDSRNARLNSLSMFDYIKFIFFCFLLVVPVYAITKSAIKHDWTMMIIDAVLVPVGFVHGLLMLFGVVN